MNNDFKKSSYLLTILFFFIGIAALVSISSAKYFSFDDLVVAISQITALAAFFIMFINCIYTKSKYNSACIRFAEYILNNRRKEADRKTADAERAREIENIRAAAERDREKAVEAALQQGRNEGAQAMSRQPMSAMQQPGMSMQQPMPAMYPQPGMPIQQPGMPAARQPQVQRGNPTQAPGTEEVLYNEYGEPIMIRRRVRKTADSPDGEMLYDSHGNPVVRRTQGLWEPLEQRHEIVVKVETAPGVSISHTPDPTPTERHEENQ